MTVTLQNALEEFEALVAENKAKTFHIFIQQNGLLLKAESADKSMLVPLDLESLNALRMFFLGLKFIEYGTFDYNNLIGFVHSHRIMSTVYPK